MLDVFCVLMLSAVLELDKYAQYLVYAECDAINPTLAR